MITSQTRQGFSNVGLQMEIQSSLQAREHRTRLLLDTSLLDDEIERLVADLTALVRE